MALMKITLTISTKQVQHDSWRLIQSFCDTGFFHVQSSIQMVSRGSFLVFS